MLFPLTWKPYGYHSCTLARESGDVLCECGVWPREFSVELYSSSGYETHSFCSQCVDGYLPSTDLDGEQTIIGRVACTWSSSATPIKVVLAEFDPGNLRWTTVVQTGDRWDTMGTGWSQTRMGAVLNWMERSPFRIYSVSPEFLEMYENRNRRHGDEHMARLEAAEAESRRQEEESRRSNTFWTETEARARVMKGKRGTISLLKYHRESSPSHLDPVREDVKGTIYGHLAIHHEGSRFALTHVPTGLSVGDPFPSQIEARMAVCLLRESGIDWGRLTAKLSDDERTIIGILLHAVEDRQVPEYTKIGAVA